MSRRLLSACLASVRLSYSGYTDVGSRILPFASKELPELGTLQSSCPTWLWTRSHKGDASENHQKHHPARHPEHAIPKHCWSCDFSVQKGGLICRACDKIQPVETGVNYFDLFGLPDSFDLRPEELEQRYKSLQWQVHPDKTVSRTLKEQLYSAQQAALVNHAFSVLHAPLPRANYLLTLLGAAREEETENVVPESDLLTQVLEARENIEETSDPEKLNELLAGVRSQEADLVSRLSSAFANSNLPRAKELVVQLSYVTKLVDAIIEKLPSLGKGYSAV